MEKFEETVVDIVADQLAVDREMVISGKSFADLGADSLDLVELVMALETEFDVEISDEKAEKIKNVYDAISFLKKALEPV